MHFHFFCLFFLSTDQLGKRRTFAFPSLHTSFHPSTKDSLATRVAAAPSCHAVTVVCALQKSPVYHIAGTQRQTTCADCSPTDTDGRNKCQIHLTHRRLERVTKSQQRESDHANTRFPGLAKTILAAEYIYSPVEHNSQSQVYYHKSHNLFSVQFKQQRHKGQKKSTQMLIQSEQF